MSNQPPIHWHRGIMANILHQKSFIVNFTTLSSPMAPTVITVPSVTTKLSIWLSFPDIQNWLMYWQHGHHTLFLSHRGQCRYYTVRYIMPPPYIIKFQPQTDTTHWKHFTKSVTAFHKDCDHFLIVAVSARQQRYKGVIIGSISQIGIQYQC